GQGPQGVGAVTQAGGGRRRVAVDWAWQAGQEGGAGALLGRRRPGGRLGFRVDCDTAVTLAPQRDCAVTLGTVRARLRRLCRCGCGLRIRAAHPWAGTRWGPAVPPTEFRVAPARPPLRSARSRRSRDTTAGFCPRRPDSRSSPQPVDRGGRYGPSCARPDVRSPARRRLGWIARATT